MKSCWGVLTLYVNWQWMLTKHFTVCSCNKHISYASMSHFQMESLGGSAIYIQSRVMLLFSLGNFPLGLNKSILHVWICKLKVSLSPKYHSICIRWIIFPSCFFPLSSVQSLSHVWLFATPWFAARQASLSIPSPGVHSDSCPSSQWCHPAISSSVVPFSSCPQSLPASESFPMSQPFSWGGQSTGASAPASFLPKKSQSWSPSEWTGWISLQSKGLSRVFSNTTVQKHQSFGAQPSSQSNSHIHTWPLEKL